MPFFHLAIEIASVPRWRGESRKVIATRKKRVGGQKWLQGYMEKRNGKVIKPTRPMARRRALKTNPEVALDALRQIADWFARIEIREYLVQGKGRLYGTNDVGVKKEFRVDHGALLTWGDDEAIDLNEKCDPWPNLLHVQEGKVHNSILNQILQGPADPGRLGCMDETPFYPFRTEIWCCVFPEDKENGFSIVSGDEAAWTLILLTFSTGSVGRSLLISRTDSASCRGTDLRSIVSSPLSYAHSSSGQITDELFDSYIDHLIQEYNPTIESPLYLQLDGHGSRSSWKNSERFIQKCNNHNIFCLFDPAAFSQIGQANDLGANKAFKEEYINLNIIAQEIETQRGSLERSNNSTRKDVFLSTGHENIRQRSLEVVAAALTNMQKGKHGEIRNGYKLACLQTPFSAKGFRDDPSRYNVGDVLRCQDTMARTTAAYLEQIFTSENIAMPRGSPIVFRSLPSGLHSEELPSIDGSEPATIMATTRKVSAARTLLDASVIWKMEYNVIPKSWRNTWVPFDINDADKDHELNLSVDDATFLSEGAISRVIWYTSKYSEQYVNLTEEDHDEELMQDYKWISSYCTRIRDEESTFFSPFDPELVKQVICKWLIHDGASTSEAPFTVYGGFVRDQVVRGEPSHDIDVAINPVTDVEGVLKRMTSMLENNNVGKVKTHEGANTLYQKRGRDVYCCYIIPLIGRWPLPIEIQFVNSSGFRCEEVDLTCNALCLSVEKGLWAKKGLSFQRCLHDVLRKQFACIIEMCVIERRAQKMRFRGWGHRRLEHEDVPGKESLISEEGKRQSLSKGQIPLDMGAIIGGTLLWEWQQVRRKAEEDREKQRATRDKAMHEKKVAGVKKLIPKIEKTLDKMNIVGGEGQEAETSTFKPTKEIIVLILKALGKKVDASSQVSALRDLLELVPIERQICALSNVLSEYQDTVAEEAEE